MPKTKCFILLFLVFSNLCLFGQKYIKDSVLVKPERNQAVLKKTFQIYNFNDKRKHPGHILDIAEKKRYLVIPVDQIYYLNRPLKEILDSLMCIDNITSDRKPLSFDIYEFSPGVRKGGLIQSYFLNAHIRVNEVSNDSIVKYLGDFVYETSIPYKEYKSNKKASYEALIHDWQKELIDDIDLFLVTPKQTYDFLLPNYKEPGYKYHNILIGNASFVGGLDWWGLEGEMFFSAPEANEFFVRNTGTARYVNAKTFESLLFGKKNQNYFWRKGKYSLFEIQSKFMFGFNRWKDIETVDHELWELFQFCFSFSEMYQFNQLDKKGITISVGAVEDIYYIFNKLDYRLGIKLSLGLKL